MLGLHSHVNFWLAMVVSCIVYAHNLFLTHSSLILSTDYLYTASPSSKGCFGGHDPGRAYAYSSGLCKLNSSNQTDLSTY